jgi:hypothetical protein
MSDIDRTRMIPLHIADQAVAACDAEIAKLRDENARLRSFCTRTIIPNIDLEKENARLKAEVERLTKAGDAMANNIPYYADVDISAETLREFTDKWNAAKEGKPHA